jgi:pyruvate dehydrogenase E2 component (dihydrolipoamide acetyltransferase)
MEVRLPRLGEGTDSGTVATVFVKVGDRLTKDQPILELESEKAVATIPSPASGIVARLHVKEGDAVKVGQMILTLDEVSSGTEAPAPARKIDVTVGDDEEEVVVEETGGEVAPGEEPEDQSGLPPAAAPSVRKVARELGIDLRRVRGSERGGRIVMSDLRRYLKSLEQRAARPAAPEQTVRPEVIDFSKWGPVEREKMSTLRRTIKTKMSESWRAVPRVTQFDEADITGLLTLKKKFDARYAETGGHLTLTALIIKTLAPLVKAHPRFNASIDEASDEIVTKKYYHFGVAVDTEQGLIVPVLRDVDRKTLLQLSIELNDLAERTRQRKVALEEMQGGSFTISNQGGIGSGHFTPVVNVPQVAILGVGRGIPKPVVKGERIEARTMLPLSLSYDHRLIDGADAARFMVELVKSLEDFKESEFTAGI